MVPIGSSVYYALMLKEETSMENNFILPIGRLKSQSGSKAPMRTRLPSSTVPAVRAPTSVASQSVREGERQIGVVPIHTVDS